MTVSEAPEPKAAAEAGADKGRGVYRLIIGGSGMLLLLLGAVGAYSVFHGTVEPSTTTAGSTSTAEGSTSGPVSTAGPGITYFGVKVGPLENGTEHKVNGTVYIATVTRIYIVAFTYDGNGDATFYAGKGAAPDGKGEIVADENGKKDKLIGYNRKTVLIRLAKQITEYQYFGIYSKKDQASYGHVSITRDVTPVVMRIRSGVQILDSAAVATSGARLSNSRQIDLLSLRYTTTPDTRRIQDVNFAVGNGDIKKNNAFRLAKGALGDISSSADRSVFLPEGRSWDQFEWFAILDFKNDKPLLTVKLPKREEIKVPVYMADARRRLRGVKRRGRSKQRILTTETSKPKVLACTFGESGVTNAMVPRDGMCDLMFYTDIQYDCDKDTIIPKDGGPAFSVFKSAASKYTKTTFGTSMSTGSIADAVKDKESELTAALEELFSSGLIHFGMLNVQNAEDYDDLKGTDLRYLKVIADFLKAKMQRRRYHSALGISLRDGSNGGKILEVAERAPHDFPGLTMIVVKLHSEGVRSSGDRWPVAPNPDGADLSEHNELSLAAIKDEVKKRLNDVARHGRYAMLSFAMYVRTYQMKASWAEVSVREMSVSSLNMDYAEVCKMKAAKDSSDAGTMYAADQQKKFLALFDSPVTFKAKTKARLHVMPKNFTGLMVYNVEMDDYKGTCGKGRFPRLKAIKEALVARP